MSLNYCPIIHISDKPQCCNLKTGCWVFVNWQVGEKLFLQFIKTDLCETISLVCGHCAILGEQTFSNIPGNVKENLGEVSKILMEFVESVLAN